MTPETERLIPSLARQEGLSTEAFLRKYLTKCGNSTNKAAAKLGVGRATLSREMARAGVVCPAPPGAPSVKLVTAFGVTDTIRNHLARLGSGLSYNLVNSRLHAGVPPELALTEPKKSVNGRSIARSLESKLEDYLVHEVNKMGGEIRKVGWVGRAGAPDRLVMFGGRCVWVELKAPNRRCEADPHQAREHRRMREHGGCDIRVLNTVDDVSSFLLELKCNTNRETTSGR